MCVFMCYVWSVKVILHSRITLYQCVHCVINQYLQGEVLTLMSV